MPLAGEGRSFFKKAYLEPGGLKEEEETAVLYLVPRGLKRAPKKEEIEARRPWLDNREPRLLNLVSFWASRFNCWT